MTSFAATSHPLRRCILRKPGCATTFALALLGMTAISTLPGLSPMPELGPSQAQAQTSEIQALNQRLQRMQGELNDLQRHVYSGGGGVSGGEAVPMNLEGGAEGTQVARLQVQLQRMERELQTMTGRLEELDHQIRQTGSQVEMLSQDIELRFSDLEGRMAALEGSDHLGEAGTGGAAGGAAGTGAGPSEAQQAQENALEFVPGSEPRTLGTIPADEAERIDEGQQQAAAGAAGAAAANVQLPEGSPQEQYQYAFGLLRQANYAEAEVALEQFLEAHPDDALAGNAKYWLGETHYVRGDYRQAAVSFAEGFQEYPEGEKAPDNLLKLGLSLAQLDRDEDACAALDELLVSYPNAMSTIRERAERERERIGC